MARKKEISYFTNLNTDEELEKFLNQDALIILDVYQELLGPCTVGMHGSIERIKISLQESDALQLGSANATRIDKLKRFCGNCRPTMLFCRKGKCVDVVYGADIPSVARKVEKHLSMKQYGDDDKAGTRYYFEFDEMVPDEKAEYERQKAIDDAEYAIRHEAEMIEKFAELDKVIDLMKKNASEVGVTLFFPHVANTALRKTHENAKWSSLVNRALKFVQLTPLLMEILNYRLENPIDEAILDYIYGKDVLIVLWMTGSRSPMTKVLKNFILSVTEPQPVEDEDGNRLSGVFKPAILNPLRLNADGEEILEEVQIEKSLEVEQQQQENEEEEEEEKEEEEVVDEDVDGSEATLGDENVEGGQIQETVTEQEKVEETCLIVPPAWTPKNQPGNAVFMYTFFKTQFDSFIPRDASDEDPFLIMTLPAKKYEEAFEICENFPKSDLLTFGYFDGNEFDNFKLICKTTECYEKIPKKKGSDKLIMKLAMKTSNLMMALATLGPLHVSLTFEDAREECSMVFNEEFDLHKDVGIDTRKLPK